MSEAVRLWSAGRAMSSSRPHVRGAAARRSKGHHMRQSQAGNRCLALDQPHCIHHSHLRCPAWPPLAGPTPPSGRAPGPRGLRWQVGMAQETLKKWCTSLHPGRAQLKSGGHAFLSAGACEHAPRGRSRGGCERLRQCLLGARLAVWPYHRALLHQAPAALALVHAVSARSTSGGLKVSGGSRPCASGRCRDALCS